MKRLKRICTILLSIIIIISFLVTCKSKLLTAEERVNVWESHFGFMPAALDFKSAQELDVHWDRPFFEVFSWDVIEPQPGQFNWMKTDHYIRQAQQSEFHILVTIHPFAAWDQMICHKNLPPVEGFGGGKRLGATMGRPCDMEAYAAFVRALVERYDDDGQDDMPGLKYPIRYWEVGNEPSMQRGPLIFFQGSSQDYLEILKTTYRAVKEADPQAQVVQGGMADTDESRVNFWNPVFAGGGATFFDIANIHSIDYGEGLHLHNFKQFLARHGVKKPFWITEVQFGRMTVSQPTPEKMANTLGRSLIYALANGAEKLFYVQLRTPPGEILVEESAFVESASLLSNKGQPQPIYFAYRTILQKLDRFETVEKIEEHVVRTQIERGKYKFIVDGRPIYVLWGQGEKLNAGGLAQVTDLLGHEKTVELSSVTLTESPLFIETEIELYP